MPSVRELRRTQIILSLMALGLPLSAAEQRRVAENPMFDALAQRLRKRALDGAIVGDSGVIYGSLD